MSRELDGVRPSVQTLQLLARALESDLVRAPSAGGTVVRRDRQLYAEPLVLSRGPDGDRAGLVVSVLAAAYHAFRDRRQHHARHQGVEDIRRHVHADVIAARRLRLADLDEAVEQRELLLQRDFLRPLIAQRGSEQLAQSAEHVDDRLLLSLTRQRRDVVQGVEQEVGIDSLLEAVET